MEKKVGQISQAFQHLRFTECLTLIDQTLKKLSKADKKKAQLTPLQLRLVKCFKAGSLVSLGRIHEANSVFEELLDKQSIELLSKEHAFLFLSIGELFGQNREATMLDLCEKHSPAFNKTQIYRFCLSSRQFSSLSKLFLKDFMGNQNKLTQLGQIYLEYLQSLEKSNLIKYQRDNWYKYDERLKSSLKLVSMFLQKFIKTAQEQKEKQQKDFKQKEHTQTEEQRQQNLKMVKTNKKMVDQAYNLKLRISINQGRGLDAIKLFDLVSIDNKFPFTFIRSILKLKEVSGQKQAIQWFYLRSMSKIFRKNLNFNEYSPFYDYYNQFLQYLLSSAQQTNLKFIHQFKLQEKHIQFEKLYVFDTLNFSQLINIYFSSLFTQYQLLTDKNNPQFETNRKSDYYKICIKGLILQLIQICHHFGIKEKLIKYLKDYTSYFSSTLTYSNQMKIHRQIIIDALILIDPESVSNQNQLIQEINYHKFRITRETKATTKEGFQITLKQLNKLYTIRVKQIQKNRKLQKGQRYLSDQFYTIISDYARAYIQSESNQAQILKTVNIMINELQYVVEVSPYNADTKLRLMYFCSLLNHYQRMIQIYFSNDIKSVQIETLGYWFLRPSLQYDLLNNYDHFAEKFVKSYQENQRETSQYGLKALKAGQLQRVDQYLTYRNCILNSYNSIILLYFLYQKYRFQNNSYYYLIKINSKLNKFKNNQRQLTFNADFKVMNNQIFEDYHFGQLYGIYNSYQILQNEVNLYMHEHFIISLISDNVVQDIKVNLIDLSKLEEHIQSFQVNKLFDFNNYTFQQQRPSFNFQKSNFTLARNSAYLQNFKNISQLRISVIKLSAQLQSYLKSQQIKPQSISSIVDKVLLALKQLRIFFDHLSYRHQIHAISLIRKGLFQSYNLLNFIRQTVAKNKKLKFAKEITQKSASFCAQNIVNTLMQLKWTEKRQQLQSKITQNRNELLERQLSLDQKQVKKILSKYQNLYK